MSSSNGRVAIPGQVGIGVTVHPGPNAHPAAVQLQGNGGVQMHIFGGLTKLEQIAGMVASRMEERLTTMGDGPQVASNVDYIASRSVVIAQAVLAECEKAHRAAQSEKSNAD